MQVKCYNKKCLHKWNYQGENKKFICCPKCRFKRMLFKCKEFYLKEHTKKNIPNDRPNDIPSEKTHYNKIIEQKQTDFIVKDAKPLPEILEGTIKICKVHNLPARYDDLEKKWECNKCSDSIFEEQEKVFDLVNFNMEVSEKEWKEMPVKVSHGLQGTETIIKKYRTPLINNIGTLTYLKKDENIRTIQRDPIKILEHQQSYF